MPRRQGAVHVATTSRRYKGKLYQTHLLRRTYREGGHVRHETLGNISHLPPHLIELVRAALRGESYLPAGEAVQIRRSLPHGHVAAVLGTLRKLGLERVLASRDSPQRRRAVALISARLIEPCSKLATARGLAAETASSSLAEELELEGVSAEELYATMDWLLGQQGRIERKLAGRHLDEGSLILYDVSSSYYTGTHCGLAEYGFSRDGHSGFPQIVYGVLCNAAGCPVAVEVFGGRTGDPMTLGAQVQKIRQRFALRRVILVGDRGMITSRRIDEELRSAEGLDWITALRAPAVQKLAKQGVIQPSLFDQRDLAEVASPQYPGERLIVCRNPLLAEERARKREELLGATEKLLDRIVAATQRSQRPLRGREKIALRVGKTINHFKVAKHFVLQITDTGFGYGRDQQKIAAEAALDGLYVIRTSVPKSRLDAEGSVRAYKDLAKVERAFRSLKTIDLHVRPIHHRLDERVRAHVFLCMLAYYVEWHMRQALAPILFDEDDPIAAAAQRESIVAPAQRSPSALRKALTKRTEQGGPVHSFRSLLKDLATLAKNRVCPLGQPAGEFDMLTQPTALQRHAFDLLGVSPAL